jgi:ABC-type proline/glycine betaine transport system permease subunit
MMAFKTICFAAVGAVLALPVFFLFGLLIVMLTEGMWRPFGTLAPVNMNIIIAMIGIPVGAYYGAIFASRSRGYSFRDYLRSIRDFLNNT